MDIAAWCENEYSPVFRHFSHGKGIYVMDEQWDNLVILDACRYDTFKETNTIAGMVSSRISRGSDTAEFLLENFTKYPKRTTFTEIVYIAGNAWVSSLLSNRFHKIYSVWDYGWDDQLGTVPPQRVVEQALDAHAKYGDKKLIVHFMQPHFPALTGPLAKLENTVSFARETARKGLNPIKESAEGKHAVQLSDLLKQGKLGREDVISAYKENLTIVLSSVEKLVNELSGRIVITADHGETFGERPGLSYPFRVFGHPRCMHVKPLVVVPWLAIEGGDQRTANRGKEDIERKVYSDEEDAKIKDRLRKLGYD